jgi:hypothetical protein
MEVKGKYLGIISDDKGTTKENKDWRRVTFEIMQEGKYPKSAFFSVSDDSLITMLSNLKHEELITVAFNIDGRKHNGKGFNNINAWKISI